MAAALPLKRPVKVGELVRRRLRELKRTPRELADAVQVSEIYIADLVAEDSLLVRLGVPLVIVRPLATVTPLALVFEIVPPVQCKPLLMVTDEPGTALKTVETVVLSGPIVQVS